MFPDLQHFENHERKIGNATMLNNARQEATNLDCCAHSHPGMSTMEAVKLYNEEQN